MRKFTFISFLVMLAFTAQSQISYEATGDYGKLWNITYDKNVPNKLYAITLVNHIMVSTDNGLNWNILYTFPQGYTHLGDMKLAPDGKALTFTVANNMDGQTNGLYILDLSSNTITKHFVLPNWQKNPAIVSYSIFNERANSILLTTAYSENFAPFTSVYYTANGGTDWTEVYFSASYSDVQINSGVISPADSTKLFLARGLGSQGINGGLFISTNSGANWIEKLDNSPLDPITFNPANANEFFAGTAISFGEAPEALFHSTDGGTSFETIAIPWADQTLNNITVIKYDPSNTSNLWLLEDNEFGKSTDGGHTWSMKSFSPDNPMYSYGTSIAINPNNSSQVFITSDGWPQYSSDGTATLTQLKNPFCLVDAVTFASYPTSQDVYYSTQSGFVHKNLTTGINAAYKILSPFTVNITRQLNLTFVDSTVPGRVFIYHPEDGFATASTLQYSNDYGATLLPLPTENYSTAISFLVKDPNNPNQYWVSYSTFDASPTLYKLNVTDAANPVATPVTPPDANAVITGISIASYSSNVVYITQGLKVYKSIDGGLNWQDKSTGLESLLDGADAVWDIKNNPLNASQFLIATSQGLFISKDSTENWALTLAGNNIRKVNFSTQANGQIIAGSYTSLNSECQLFYTIDSAATWKTVLPEALSYLGMSGMDFKFNPGNIDVYLATNDLGLVKYTVANLPNPLPVQLFSFTGYLQNNNAQLVWKTSNEINAKEYQVLRSIDGITFENIGTVPAKNTSGDNTYTFEDKGFATEAVKKGIVYYRLKMVDIDSRFTYSNIINLSARNNGVGISIYPNPVGTTINLQFQSINAGRYSINVYDAIGKLYSSKAYTLLTGNSMLAIPAVTLATGTYTLVVAGADGIKTQIRFIKH